MGNQFKILLDFTHPRGSIRTIEKDGKKWELKGECNRCGLCCERSKMPIVEFQKEDKTCKHFSYETVDGKKLGKCAIMWHRPAFCLLYPHDPDDPLIEECGYWWEEVN